MPAVVAPRFAVGVAAVAAVACLGVLAHARLGYAAGPGPVAAAAAVPTPEEIIRRVLTANANTPDIASADVLFRVRFRKPVTAPPDCEFQGLLHFEGGRHAVEIERRSPGLTCWIVNSLVIGRLFEGSEPVETFLSRFEFEVLGEKLVEAGHFYLVLGRARVPGTNPRGLIGWVDYDRGLVTEGTVRYPWGDLDTQQHYTQLSGAWVLTYQYLYTERWSASMEVFYRNFKFALR